MDPMTLLFVCGLASSVPERCSTQEQMRANSVSGAAIDRSPPPREFPEPAKSLESNVAGPWTDFVTEAAMRFAIPEPWIWAVMKAESGGHAVLHGRPITSEAGAMGLMQLMPATYDELRLRYGLGPDPHDPHDNILAGAAYLREMLDRYGAPLFLAAYNAGPARLDQFLFDGKTLPTETQTYLAVLNQPVSALPLPVRRASGKTLFFVLQSEATHGTSPPTSASGALFVSLNGRSDPGP